MQASSTRALADYAHSISMDAAPAFVREAVSRTLIDSVGVTLAGWSTPEHRALREHWPTPPGRSTLWGGGGVTDVPTATMLNAVALCMLELDEGNKFARGHPGAHVLPVTLAESERLGESGIEVLNAFLAGYEVASRMARAFQPRAGLHPHGTWGAVGAAAALARLRGFSTDRTAEAMDAAAALSLAPPFSSALRGSFVRNTWVGAAGVNALTAANIAGAGLGSIDGTAAATFGTVLGGFDDDTALAELGQRWEITGGYFKRHSSCNYTHPPADAALILREDPRFSPTRVTDVSVITHALAIPLADRAPRNRLAAMFSIPHVVAVALAQGHCRPDSFAAAALEEADVVRLRRLVRVTLDEEIDARRPAQRGARVVVSLDDGQSLIAEVPNAIGDADHHPLSTAEVREKVRTLIGADRAAAVDAAIGALHDDASVSQALSLLIADHDAPLHERKL